MRLDCVTGSGVGGGRDGGDFARVRSADAPWVAVGDRP